QFFEAPDAREMEQVAARGPLLFKFFQRRRRFRARPVVSDIQKPSAGAARCQDFIDRKSIRAGRVDAALECNFCTHDRYLTKKREIITRGWCFAAEQST